MGETFYNLSCEELCDMMCGKAEREPHRRKKKVDKTKESDGGKDG